MAKPGQGVDFSGKHMDADSVLNHQAQNAENAEQKMAFELYYRLGVDRTHTKVAEQTGRHVNSIRGWADKLRWEARIEEREKIAAEHSLTVQKIVAEQDLKKKHVNVFDVAITKAVKEVADGSVKIKTVGELIALIDARWKLADHASPNHAPSMHFHGPTQVDMGLEKMNRDERIKFLQDMLTGIMRVQTRAPMGSRAVIDVPKTVGPGVKPVEPSPAESPDEFAGLTEDVGNIADVGEVSLDIED